MKNEVKLVGVVQRNFGSETRGTEPNTWIETDFILAVKRGENSWDNIPVKVKKSVKVKEKEKVSLTGALRVDSWQDDKSKEWKSRSYVVTSSVDVLSKEEFKAAASGSAV